MFHFNLFLKIYSVSFLLFMQKMCVIPCYGGGLQTLINNDWSLVMLLMKFLLFQHPLITIVNNAKSISPHIRVVSSAKIKKRKIKFEKKNTPENQEEEWVKEY